MEPYVIKLAELGMNDVEVVGGKNASLGEMISNLSNLGVTVPGGFATTSAAYRAFLAALQMNGLTVVPFGSFLKIVESKTAIQEPQDPFDPGERLPNEARMVTAIVPVENSNEGVVSHTLDLFVESPLTICAEIHVAIHHDLLSKSGDMRQIKKVGSHPQALAQCRGWLELNLPNAAQESTPSQMTLQRSPAGHMMIWPSHSAVPLHSMMHV